MTTAMAQEHHHGLRRDAAENRRRLLDAARHVFAVHGTEAGVELIAHEAGVGIGTLYRRFPTKDALIAELVRELLEEVLALARSATRVPGGDGLEQFLYDMGEAQASNRGCLSRMWTDHTTTIIRDEIRSTMAALLATSKENKRIRAGATLTDLDLLFWALRGILEAIGDDARAACRRQVAITLAGLRPSPDELCEPPVALH
jgi:AcrR family transcriptional regulator